MKNNTKEKDMAEQGHRSNRVHLIARHLMKYGGCWIFALIVYTCIIWIIPWELGGTPWAVLASHGVVALVAWAVYGLEQLDKY